MSGDPRRPRSTSTVRGFVLVLACALVACDNQVPSASPAASAALPSAAISTPGPGASSPAVSSEPSAESKIDGAEAAGTIDHPTALLYKLFAALDGGSLPSEYRSTNPEIPEGTIVLAELAAGLADLAPDIRAQVEPFLLRPTEPGSFWQQRAATAGADGVSLAAYRTAAIEFAYEDADRTNVRVWYATELGGEERALAAQLADEIDSSDMWAKERTAMLGHEPCSDAKVAYNGGNGRLDIYLVYPSTGLDWGGRSDQLGYDDEGNPHNGVDIPDGPGDGCPVATHIILNAAVAFARLKSTTAHELFHAFQHSFKNAYLPDRSWLGEATATWAKHLVYPEQNFEQEYLDGYWSEASLPEGPIDSVKGNAAYATYLLPFYLVQHSGDATGKLVGRLWLASETAPSIKAVAALPGWTDRFKQYALWNWNAGEARKYVDNGTAIPPASLKQHTACLDSHIVSGGDCILKLGTLDAFIDVPAASVTYLEVVPDQPVVERVTFDLTDLLEKPGLGVQALLTIDGSSEVKVEDWTKIPERIFCLPSEDLRKLVLVVSNSNVDPDASIQGRIKVEAESSGCTGWLGTITSEWDYGTVNHRKGNLRATVHFTPDPAWPEFFLVTEGTATWSETGSSGENCTLSGGGTYPLVVPGDEQKVPGSRAGQLRIWQGGDLGLLRYSGIGHQDAVFSPQFSTLTCDGGLTSQQSTDAGVWWTFVSDLPPPVDGYTGEESLTFPVDATQFSGTYTHRVEGEVRQTWTWTFVKLGGS